MSKLRHPISTLTALALLAAVAVLATTPAHAQDDTPQPPTKFFVFTNAMTNPDADNDGRPDTRWQVQVTVSALGNCVPTQGNARYTSTWIEAGEEVGTSLSLTECVFRISARVRQHVRPDCLYHAQLGWSDDGGNVTGDYRDASVVTAGRPGDESRLSIRRDPARGCTLPHRTYFVLGGDSVVEDLPGASVDPDLVARARRAAAVGEYTVRVESDTSTPGCDITRTFTLQGDRSTSPQVLGVTGDRCPSRAAIVAAPAHVKVSASSRVTFDAALPNIIVDLTSLLRIESARIAIVQDVVGSANRGEVGYAISRSCGGLPLDSPAPQAASTTLFEGRFTVHSPDIPQFGAVEIYPAVATSANSFTVVGCAVTVIVANVPAGCLVVGGRTKTLAWTAANPIDRFDFEFDIGCGGEAPPIAPPPATAPPTGDPTGTSTDPVATESGTDRSGTGQVRVVARRLENGNLEFGLQQWRHAGSWSGRVFPTARMFPATATVGTWLNSRAITLGASESADSLAEDVQLRITARKHDDGRVEFGLQRWTGTSWGEREFPTGRYFPTGAQVDRWLGSSAINLDG